MQLGDLAEIGRPVASLGRQEEDGIEVREVTPSDIDDSGQLHQGSKRIRLPKAALAKGRQQRLEPGDVLLSIKGGLGRVAVVQDLECPTVPGQGTAVAFVPMGEVKSRPVGIPHPSELQRAEALQQESVALRREIEELSRKLQRLSCQGWMQDLPPALLVDDQGEAA